MGTDLKISDRTGEGYASSNSGSISSWSEAREKGIQLAQVSLTPPGDCTWSRFTVLQNEVEAACKGQTRRCEDTDNSAQLQAKIDMTARCIRVRANINTACFRGGDIGHQEQVRAEQNGLQRCHSKLAAAKQRETAQAPVAERQQTESSSGFWKRMETLTGLTGTALVLYVIISEGSRAFPPRNLVLVP